MLHTQPFRETLKWILYLITTSGLMEIHWWLVQTFNTHHSCPALMYHFEVNIDCTILSDDDIISHEKGEAFKSSELPKFAGKIEAVGRGAVVSIFLEYYQLMLIIYWGLWAVKQTVKLFANSSASCQIFHINVIIAVWKADFNITVYPSYRRFTCSF